MSNYAIMYPEEIKKRNKNSNIIMRTKELKNKLNLFMLK